jgi:hypothetical protein
VHPERQRKTRKGLAIFAALIAVFVQALVVQTHVDGLAGLAPAATAVRQDGQPGSAPVQVASAAKISADVACPICQAAATAGRTVMPSATVLPLPAHASRADALFSLVSTTPRLSHAWRSRAPPIAL